MGVEKAVRRVEKRRETAPAGAMRVENPLRALPDVGCADIMTPISWGQGFSDLTEWTSSESPENLQGFGLYSVLLPDHATPFANVALVANPRWAVGCLPCP